MIVAYPFCLRDQELALKNAQWINELGGGRGHQVLCCYDVRCPTEAVEAVGTELLKGFDKVWRLPAQAEIDGWPEGANYMFRICTAWLAAKPEWSYFLWMEPDAIPMVEGWLDKLEAQYKRAGRPFMGDRVEVKVDGNEVPLHMSGVGIYQNPIYLLAGEAYRAHDVAWDMAGKDQIIPQAHFTDLIEHAWKHPKFTSNDELRTQIAPQTILFHSSKDGSLIDLLRQKKRGRKQSPEEGGSTSSPSVPTKEPEEPGSPSPLIYDIFIRTYPGDYEWLYWCIRSIDKFVTGFRKIWIISPADAPEWMNPRMHSKFHSGTPIEWKVMNDETEDGYLAQQITKLYADVLTDYQADYILHVDSDVIFSRPTTPGDFFKDGKLIWYYTPYEAIQTPWQPIIEKFMGFTMPYEFMRRLPMMLPRWLYPKMREFCHSRHGRIISQYIQTQPLREFSEFNALGAYAYFNHPDQFAWINTNSDIPEPCARQFHSWSGFTPAIKLEIEKILGAGGEPLFDGRIRMLDNDLWVLEGDQISDWVIEEGRLDHDQNLLPDILKHIAPGDTVVDAGAFIGDHTVAYSNAVGSMGVVYAFEPNPVAFKCLEHNTAHLKNVSRFTHGLSDKAETVPLSGNNGNQGGAYVGEHMKVADVMLSPLDLAIPWGADFIKIDVEGYEVKALAGAEGIINKYRPKMVIEINEEALRRQGNVRGDIFRWLENHAYDWKIIQENCCWNDPLYDILAVPAGGHQPTSVSAQPETYTGGADSGVHVVVLPTESLPQGSSLTPKGQMIEAVKFLETFAGESVKNRMMVRQRLAFAGLAHKKPKKHEPKKDRTKSR